MAGLRPAGCSLSSEKNHTLCFPLSINWFFTKWIIEKFLQPVSQVVARFLGFVVSRLEIVGLRLGLPLLRGMRLDFRSWACIAPWAVSWLRMLAFDFKTRRVFWCQLALIPSRVCVSLACCSVENICLRTSLPIGHTIWSLNSANFWELTPKFCIIFGN